MAQRVPTVLVLACTLALGGCATRWVVDSQVRSFSELPADAAARTPVAYRFERLPLQQQGPEAARLLLAPAELPIGIVTAFIGAPFFLFLLMRGRS